MPETSTNNEGGPEQGREQAEESKEKKLEKGIVFLWDDLIAKSPALNVVFEQNEKKIGNLIESFKNGGGNMDNLLALTKEAKTKKQAKASQESALQSELEEIDRNYGLAEVKEALDEDKIDKDRAARKHFKLKSGLFKRAWWKLGDAFGINKGQWEALANQNEQAGIDLEKKHRLRKVMQGKKGQAVSFFWNTFGKTDFMRERDKLWKLEEIQKAEKELNKTIKLLGELLSLSVRVEEHQPDSLAGSDEQPEVPSGEPNEDVAPQSVEEAIELGRKTGEKIKIKGDVRAGEDEEEQQQEVVEQVEDSNNTEEQWKTFLGEEHFTESPKKPEEKINMSIYDKNPNKIFEELADALGGEEFRKRKEERDIMHEFADALNSKESTKKRVEPSKKLEPRKDAPADIMGTGGEKKPDLGSSSREGTKDKKSFEEIAKEMVENGKWMKGKFVYNKDNDNFSFAITKNGKETVYVINGYDGNLKAGSIKDGEEYYFEISTKKDSNDPIYILSPDKTGGKKEVIAVWIRMPKERKDDINKRLKETESSLKNLLNSEDVKNELNEDLVKGIRADLNNENYGELIEKLSTLEELSEGRKKETLEEMIKLIKIIEAAEGNKGNRNDSEKGGSKTIKVEKSEDEEKQIKVIEGLLDNAVNKKWMDESHKQRILKAIEAKDREAVFDVLDEIRDQDVDISKIEGVSGADYWEKPFKDPRKRTPDIKEGDLRKVTPKNKFIDNELVSAINKIFNAKSEETFFRREPSDKQVDSDSLEIRKLKVELRATKDKLTRLTDKAVDEKWVEVLDRMKYMEAILNDKYEEIISKAENLASKFPEDQREEFIEKVKENVDKLKKTKEELNEKAKQENKDNDLDGTREIDKKNIDDIRRGLKSANMSEHVNEIIKAINQKNVDVLREIIPELKEKRDKAKKNDKKNITRVINILTKEFPDL